MRLEGHKAWIEAVAFAPDGKTLVSAGADKLVKLWNPARGQEVTTLTGHRNRILSVAFSPDGKMLASAGHEQIVKLWKPKQ